MNINSSGVGSTPRHPYLHIELGALSGALNTEGVTVSALKCFLAVEYRVRVTKNPQVKLTGELCRTFGITDRKAKRNGIQFWVERGRWDVNQAAGKNPVITALGGP
jgi:hypothetical protein